MHVGALGTLIAALRYELYFILAAVQLTYSIFLMSSMADWAITDSLRMIGFYVILAAAQPDIGIALSAFWVISIEMVGATVIILMDSLTSMKAGALATLGCGPRYSCLLDMREVWIQSGSRPDGYTITDLLLTIEFYFILAVVSLSGARWLSKRKNKKENQRAKGNCTHGKLPRQTCENF